jgi:hypothetical protein
MSAPTLYRILVPPQELVVNLVDSLAWPVTVVTLVLILRRQIGTLVSGSLRGRLIKKMRAGPVEVEWETAMAEAVDSLDTLVDPEVDGGGFQHAGSEAQDLLRLANSYPSAAVMMASARLENAIRSGLERSGNLPPDRRLAGFGQVIGDALQHGVISKEMLVAVDALRMLRNQVAHARATFDEDVTPARAAQYVLVAEALGYAIRDGE